MQWSICPPQLPPPPPPAPSLPLLQRARLLEANFLTSYVDRAMERIGKQVKEEVRRGWGWGLGVGSFCTAQLLHCTASLLRSFSTAQLLYCAASSLHSFLSCNRHGRGGAGSKGDALRGRELLGIS